MNRRQFLKLSALMGSGLPFSTRSKFLLQDMTLRQKVGQLFMFTAPGRSFTADMRRLIVDYHAGGLVFFDYNIGSPEDITRLTNTIQETASTPLFIAVDQEGGVVQRLKEAPFSLFPNAMALGAANNHELTIKAGQAIAEELLACGLNMNLAPVLDVNVQPNNSVINLRAFGSDPVRVGMNGIAYILGMQSRGIIATGKHFPGHGNTDEDSHYTLPTIPTTRDALLADLTPFTNGIEAEVGAIMTAHILYPALDATHPATFSQAILTELLRNELGFEGVIMTDALTMGAVKIAHSNPVQMLHEAITAGIDILTYGALPNGSAPTIASQIEAFEIVMALLDSGQLSEAQIDLAVTRILALKERFNLMQWSPRDPNQTREALQLADHQALIESIADAAITIYLDTNQLMPLDRSFPVLILYPAGFQDLATTLSEGLAEASLQSYPAQLSVNEANRIAAESAERVVICVTRDTHENPAQITMVNALPLDQTIVLATQSPYDWLNFPLVKSYALSYGDSPSAMRAARDVIFGERPALGTLPVFF